MQTASGSYPTQSDEASIETGNFQFRNLRPGRYYIWASAPLGPPNFAPQQVTYFPSSPNFDGAQPVDVGFESDAKCNRNIQLRTSLGFHVRGKVPEPIPHAADESFEVDLMETNRAGVEHWSGMQSEVQPGGSFDFANVHAGRYRLRLSGPYRKSNGMAVFSGPCRPSHDVLAYRDIVAGDGDLDVGALNLDSHVSLTGEVHFEDVPKEWKGFQIRVPDVLSLSVEDAMCPYQVQLTPQGKLDFAHFEAGTYHVDLGLQGQPLYVKLMLLDGQPVTQQRITVKPGQPAKLDVVVSGKVGEVELEVLRNRLPAEDYRYGEPCQANMPVGPYAFLIPDPAPPDGSGLLVGESTDQGYLRVIGVPPGRYRAVAGENFNLFGMLSREDAAWKDQSFLRAVAAFGQPLEVSADQTVRLRLHSSTAEIQDTLAARKKQITMVDHCAVSCSYSEFWTGSVQAQK